MHKHILAYMIGFAAGTEVKEAMEPELARLFKRLKRSGNFSQELLEYAKFGLKANWITIRMLMRVDVVRLEARWLVAGMDEKKAIAVAAFQGYTKGSSIVDEEISDNKNDVTAVN